MSITEQANKQANFLFLLFVKFNIVYVIGVIFLFFGLLWMFLPHLTHEAVLSKLGQSELEGESHFEHTFQGLVGTLIGLGLLMYDERKQKKK